MNIKQLLDKFEKETFYKMEKYSQFTIDAIEEFQEEIDNLVEVNIEEGEKRSEKEVNETLVDSISYKVDNYLKIMKEGADMELFKILQKDLKKI